MTKLKKHNLSGEATGEMTVNKALMDVDVNPQLIKDYIVALRANARQWSANTKGRSEVSHSNQKPHRQKGTGNARQGTLAAPQYRGGGIVFGPKPKFNQHIRVNRKERRAAIRQILSEKLADKRVFILKDFAELKQPKTKTVHQFLQACKIANRPVLFVGEEGTDKHEAMRRSVRNIPRSAFVLAANVNGYDLACAHNIVFSEAAFKEFSKLLVEA